MDVNNEGFFEPVEQEPVALQYPQKDIDWQREQQIKAQASTPPQRTWVGLHTTTILDIYTETLKTHRGGSMPDGQIAFAKAIEQALKERNT